MRLVIVSALITHFLMSVRDGISYMTSSRISSIRVLSPRAPVLYRSDASAAASSASGVKTSSTLSRARNLEYCLVIAFLGSTRMRTRSSLVRRVERDGDGQPADELGDEPELKQIVRVSAGAAGSRPLWRFGFSAVKPRLRFPRDPLSD